MSLRTNQPKRHCVIIPDTSALLLVYEGIDPLIESKEVLADYCESIDIRLLTPVARELRRLALGRGSKAVAAKLALAKLDNYAKVLTWIDIEECPNVDKCILDYSKTMGTEAIVITTDRKLAAELKRAGIKHITWWRSRKRLILNFPTN